MSILELVFIVTCVNIINNICQHVIVFWEKKNVIVQPKCQKCKKKKKKESKMLN